MTDRMWRKAAASKANGNCVEVAPMPDGGTAVRDSKNPQGPTLEFTSAEWGAFLTAVKAGEFDVPSTLQSQAGRPQSACGLTPNGLICACGEAFGHSEPLGETDV
jgi:hypothetical protein